MRSVAVFTVFSGLALGTATSVLADGTPVSLTQAPIVRDGWSGLYIGLGGGASRVDHSSNVDSDVTTQKQEEKCYWDWDWDPKHSKKKILTKKCHWKDVGKPVTKHLASLFDDDETKGFGTVQLGYDHLFGHHLLIGAFADVDLYFGDDNDDDHGSLDVNHTWNVGGRLGFLLTPNVLLYGVGGYTQASLDTSIHVPPGPKLDDFDDPRGWFLGGGGEVKLHRGVSLKLEYRWADYGSFSDDGSGTSTSASYSHCKKCNDYRTVTTTYASADDDLEVQSIRALVVFRLDEPDAPVPLK